MAGISHLKSFSKPALQGLVESYETQRNEIEVPSAADRFIQDEQIYSNTFAYDVVQKNNHMAAMIGVGAEPPVIDRDAVAQRMGSLAKYGLKSIVTEEELLELNQPRNTQEQAALVDKLLVRGTDLVKAMRDRVQVSKMEVLAKGKVNYDDNNVKANLDFTTDMPDSHKVELTGGETWDNEDHDVIGDLLDWVQTYEDNTGERPEVILMSRETQALLLKNNTIVTEAMGIADSGKNRVSIADLNNVLAGYDLPPVEVVTKRKATFDDPYTGDKKTIEFFPKNRVVMAANGVGKFFFGPTAENDFQPGIVLDSYDHQEPIESILRVAAAGFPVIEQPNLLFHADVVEGKE